MFPANELKAHSVDVHQQCIAIVQVEKHEFFTLKIPQRKRRTSMELLRGRISFKGARDVIVKTSTQNGPRKPTLT